jgi:hypothetical protein
MKKSILAFALSSLSLAAAADGWKFAPLMSDSNFKFQPTVAATVGTVKPQGNNEATAYGLEVNFNCGLIQSPDNRIRTHLSLSRVDENRYDATLVELSPRYTVPMSNGLSIGVGPSLGGVRLDPAGAGKNETMFAYGLVGGVNYRMGALYAGLDLGVRRTAEKSGVDFDSRYATFKVGFNF